MTVRKYRWHEWFRKRQFILRRGIDYACPPGTMAQQIRNAAVKYKVKVSITEAHDGAGFLVWVQNPLKNGEQCEQGDSSKE